MTTNTLTASMAKSSRIDPLTLALAARRERDAFVAALLSRGVGRLFAGLNGWLRRRRALAELSQLDARMMADIGLDRAAFSAGVIRRIEADRVNAITAASLTPVSQPVVRHAAEPHLAPVVTPAAANDARRAA